jgi:hypothetical protein
LHQRNGLPLVLPARSVSDFVLKGPSPHPVAVVCHPFSLNQLQLPTCPIDLLFGKFTYKWYAAIIGTADLIDLLFILLLNSAIEKSPFFQRHR